MAPEISTIIVNYNTRQLLRNCLASILTGESRKIEVIVVDNHSSDSSATMVRTEFPDVQLIENSRNLGFAKANNQAIRQASGKYVLLLNSDTVVQQEAIGTMAEYMDSEPDAGAVACRLLDANGAIQASIGRQSGPGLMRQILRLSGISRLIRGERMRRFLRRYLGFAIGSTVRSYLDPYVTNTALEVESISGACLMLRRQAIDQVGLLDENFFMYLEDLDYCLRLRNAGWKLYYLPTVQIVHLIGQSSGGRMRKYSMHAYRSLFYFYQKHYSPSTLVLMRLAVFLTMSARWAWNSLRGLFSGSPAYTANRLDLKGLIRMSLQWRTVQRRFLAQETLPADCLPDSRK